MKTTNNSMNKNLSTVALFSALGAIIVGLITGFLRRVFHWDILILLNGVCMALIVQRISRGIFQRYSILGVIATFASIVISDVVFNYNLMGLLNFSTYLTVMFTPFKPEFFNGFWLVYRAVSLYVAYAYSRII